MSRQPVFVLIPGAWHRSTCYDKVSSLLQTEHGIDSYSVTLPSTSGRRDASFKDDVDAARAVISSQIDQQRDVVVVAHSYGGMVGNSAIKGLTAPKTSEGSQTRTARGKRHVIGLVLIASGFTMTGVAFMDPFCGFTPPSWRKNTETGFAELVKPPREVFYHDLPKAEGDYYVRQLTPHSLASLFEGGEYAYAGWLDIATWYIGTTEDRALPAAVQRMLVGMARGQGGDVTFRELPTSHSPFLSQPEATVQILMAALREFQDNVAESPRGVQRRQALLVHFWPQRWLRSGFWMGMGEIVGRCLVKVHRFRMWWKS